MTTRNTQTIDEPVKISQGDMPTDSIKHEHPSFGMISISRMSSSRGERLFGSDIESNTIMRLTISEASVEQSLGRNWYHDSKVITEVHMSPSQYAEMLSSHNASGTPCTISYRSDAGRIKHKSIDSQAEYVEKDIELKTKQLNKDIDQTFKDVKSVLEAKGSMNVGQKKAMLNSIEKLFREMQSNLPFMEKCMQENIEKMKTNAQIEIDAMVQHAITRAGIKVLENPESFKLLIGEDK